MNENLPPLHPATADSMVEEEEKLATRLEKDEAREEAKKLARKEALAGKTLTADPRDFQTSLDAIKGRKARQTDSGNEQYKNKAVDPEDLIDQNLEAYYEAFPKEADSILPVMSLEKVTEVVKEEPKAKPKAQPQKRDSENRAEAA